MFPRTGVAAARNGIGVRIAGARPLRENDGMARSSRELFPLAIRAPYFPSPGCQPPPFSVRLLLRKPTDPAAVRTPREATTSSYGLMRGGRGDTSNRSRSVTASGCRRRGAYTRDRKMTTTARGFREHTETEKLGQGRGGRAENMPKFLHIRPLPALNGQSSHSKGRARIRRRRSRSETTCRNINPIDRPQASHWSERRSWSRPS